VSYRLACRIRAIHGIAADMVVGSMSVHCAYYAGDLPLEGIERLGTIWRRLRRSLAGEIVVDEEADALVNDELLRQRGANSDGHRADHMATCRF
jgi:hypothetical protein